MGLYVNNDLLTKENVKAIVLHNTNEIILANVSFESIREFGKLFGFNSLTPEQTINSIRLALNGNLGAAPLEYVEEVKEAEPADLTDEKPARKYVLLQEMTYGGVDIKLFYIEFRTLEIQLHRDGDLLKAVSWPIHNDEIKDYALVDIGSGVGKDGTAYLSLAIYEEDDTADIPYATTMSYSVQTDGAVVEHDFHDWDNSETTAYLVYNEAYDGFKIFGM